MKLISLSFISLCLITFTVFLFLKITGIISLSWLLICSPLFCVLGFVVLFILILCVMVVINLKWSD